MRAAFLMLAVACVTVRWQEFDASFDEKRGAKDPVVFEGPGLPPTHRMVGVIEIFGTTDPQTILEKAVAQGREVGCDLVMKEVLPPSEDDDGAPRPPPATDHVNYVCGVEQR